MANERVGLGMKSIGSKKKVYIIAELGMNHDGSYGNAQCLIRAAAHCGVDAVKFQMHIAEEEMIEGAPCPPYFTNEDRWSFFKRTAFSLSQWKSLRDLSHKEGIDFIMSPFSEHAVTLCEQLAVDCIKIASGEVNNIFLLKNISKIGFPVILSSGMSTYDELQKAVAAFADKNNVKAILQCSSQYPCPYDQVGLNVLLSLKTMFPQIPIGFSDHTETIYATLAAVTLGAHVIERHFTLSKMAYGPDAAVSLEPHSLSEMVQGVRAIEIMLGHDVDKYFADSYIGMRSVFCKSIVAKREIKEGVIISESDLIGKKTGAGIPVSEYMKIVGKQTVRCIKKNEVIKLEDVV